MAAATTGKLIIRGIPGGDGRERIIDFLCSFAKGATRETVAARPGLQLAERRVKQGKIPMKQTSKFMIMMVTLLSCVGCDQVTKSIARQNLANGERLSFFGNIFRLQYIENPGAFLSLGAGAHEETRFIIFTVLTGLFLAGMIGYLVFSRKAGRAEVIAISLVAGGGIANLIDRVFNQGRVIDFMNMGIGSVRTGIFNVADVAITFGTLWLIILLAKKPEARKGAGE